MNVIHAFKCIFLFEQSTIFATTNYFQHTYLLKLRWKISAKHNLFFLKKKQKKAMDTPTLPDQNYSKKLEFYLKLLEIFIQS